MGTQKIGSGGAWSRYTAGGGAAGLSSWAAISTYTGITRGFGCGDGGAGNAGGGGDGGAPGGAPGGGGGGGGMNGNSDGGAGARGEVRIWCW